MQPATDLSKLRSHDGKITAYLANRTIVFAGGKYGKAGIHASPEISNAARILAHFDGYCESNGTGRKRDPSAVLRLSGLTRAQADYIFQANMYNAQCCDDAVCERSDSTKLGATYVEAPREVLDDLDAQLELMEGLAESARDQAIADEGLSGLALYQANQGIRCIGRLRTMLDRKVASDVDLLD